MSSLLWYMNMRNVAKTDLVKRKALKSLITEEIQDFAPAKDAGSRTRTGTRLPPSDFESDASAIPPRRLAFATRILYHKWKLLASDFLKKLSECYQNSL